MTRRLTFRTNMRAMVFLFVRTFINSLKRALTSPKRLIGLIFFAAYFFSIFFRSFFVNPTNPKFATPDFKGLSLPPMVLLDACLFALFGFLSLLFLSSSFNNQATFKQSDVDVLFPTPISPKLVMLFRMVRDSFFSFLLPLIMLGVLWRPAGPSLALIFKNLPNPASANYIFRVGPIAYFLMAIGLTAFSYGLGLFLNRPTGAMDRVRKISGWAFTAAFALFGVWVYTQFQKGATVETFVSITQNTPLRIVLLPGWAAASLTSAPLSGNLVAGLLSLGTLVLVIFGGIGLAMSQTGWFYEQTALRVETTRKARDVQTRGDIYAAYAARAQAGSFKTRRSKWLNRLRPRRTWGLIWKEAVLAVRTGSMTFIFLGLFAIGIGSVAGMVAKDARNAPSFLPVLFLSLIAFFVSANLSQIGFLETLRRVDLLKPLPFPPWKTVLAEVLGKALIGLLPLLLGVAPILIMAPTAWVNTLGAFITALSLMVLLCSVNFLMIVMFPDIDDPTQRGFRGLMSLLGLIIFLAPSGLLFAFLIYMEVPGIIAAFPVLVMNLGLGAVAAYFAGQLYAGFNPSE